MVALATVGEATYPQLVFSTGLTQGAIYLSIRRASYRGWIETAGYVRKRGAALAESTRIKLTPAGREALRRVEEGEHPTQTVRAILATMGRGTATGTQLAADLSVSEEGIWAIVHRRKWRRWFEEEDGHVWLTDAGAAEAKRYV